MYIVETNHPHQKERKKEALKEKFDGQMAQ